MPTMLFDSCTFTMAVPPEFDSYNKESTTYLSKFNAGTTTRKSTLHAPTLRAVMSYIKLSKATTDGAAVDDLGAIGTQNGEKIIAEYIGGRKDIQGIVYNKNSGQIFASVYTNENASAAVFEHKSKGGKETGSAIFFAMMPIFLEDEEFKEYYDKLYDQFVAGFSDPPATEEAIFKICDNVYRRIEYPNACGTSKVKFEEPATGSIRQISEYARRQGTYSPTDVLYGVFKVVKPGVTPKKKKAVISVKDFAGKYKLSEREFNEKEQLLIPKLPDWYVIPEEVELICNFAQKTTDSQMPMRNFMLRGAAGSGKTEGAKAIAAGLGLPYMFLTCSADAEIFDFIGQILPSIDGFEFEDAGDTPYIPTISEIDSDPVGTYYNMTGEFNEEITAEEVKTELDRILREKEEKKKPEKDFRYVYTPLIEAIKNGYVVEIQERATRLRLKRPYTNNYFIATQVA